MLEKEFHCVVLFRTHYGLFIIISDPQISCATANDRIRIIKSVLFKIRRAAEWLIIKQDRSLSASLDQLGAVLCDVVCCLS